MIDFASLAWLYWDPSRVAFTIPYFDIPIVWYGVLFALGFIVGYFILLPILQRLFLAGTHFYPRDVDSWIIFTECFRAQPNYVAYLPQHFQTELKALPKGSEPSTSLKQAILDSLNNVLQHPSSGITRPQLERDFSGALVSSRSLSIAFADKLTWFVVIGTVIGARLGHVLFYEWPYYAAHPIEIFMLRKGGLASHGGTLGVILALILFVKFNRKRFPDITLIQLIDMLVIPTAFTVFCIRLGNFFNQEILGNVTNVPWAIVFGNPADGSIPAPRHPVQLYEGAVYLATFFFLYALWKVRGSSLKPGTLSGLFFIIVFGSRFFLEFFKELQGSIIDETFLQMGQYLSIPFVLLGLFLLIAPARYLGAKKL